MRAGADVRVEVNQPRPFGYVVGDIAEQSVTVHAPGYALTEDSVPKLGRISAWLERTRAVVVRTHDGFRLDLAYQFVNAPPEIRTLSLPIVKLPLRIGDRAAEAEIDEWPVTVAPLTPETILARAGLEEMQPDAPPPRVDTRWIVRRLVLYACAAALIGVFWASWRFGWSWRGRRPRPFAHAAREIHALATKASLDNYHAALRALHSAFNLTAGTTLFAPGIERFLAADPRFAALRTQIEAFFAQSQRAFFAGSGAAARDMDFVQLRTFATRLAEIEREAG